MQISLLSYKITPSIALKNGWVFPIVFSLLLHIILLLNTNTRQQAYTHVSAMPSVSSITFAVSKSSNTKNVQQKGITESKSQKKEDFKEKVSDNDKKISNSQDIPTILAKDLGISGISPKYPRRAIEFNWQGKAIILARIFNGIKQEVILQKSSGYKILDNSALDAVNNWVIPKNIQSGEYWIKLPIEFHIK